MSNSRYLSDNHHELMAQAIRLANKGLYTCDPNPRVGCVLVNDGIIIGEGWHAKAGEEHAEIMALRSASLHNPNYIKGSTAYVTLEPCCHTGKTGPCTHALIDAGIQHVVIGMIDPNPKVAGQGIAALEAAGIQVTAGILPAQCAALNPGFIQRMQAQRPYVRVKLAASLDGKTALNSGESQWVTGAAARDDVQKWRARSSAVMTGIQTIMADNPRLTVRAEQLLEAKMPLRIVLDSQLTIDPAARVLAEQGDVLIVTASEQAADKIDALRAAHVEVIQLPADAQGHVNLTQLMQILADAEINELMVESGATLAGSLLAAEYVDELVLYLAPSIMGHHAKGLFDLPALTSMNNKIALTIQDTRQIGNDIRLIAKPEY